MILAAGQVQSDTWQAIVEHCTARLQALRERNDEAMDEIRTATLRGQIAEVKALLTLGDPGPVIQSDEV